MRLDFLVILFLQMFTLSQPLNVKISKAWQDAATYLKQFLNSTADVCADFYKHVCGKYDSNDNIVFEKGMDQSLKKAISEINIWSNDTVEYQRMIKFSFDNCFSMENKTINSTHWMKRLYNAIKERIGGLPLFAQLEQPDASASMTTSFDPWELIGVAQRKLGESIFLKASVDYVEIDFKLKPQLQLEVVLPPGEPPGAELGASLNVDDMRLLIFELAKDIGLTSSNIEPIVDDWLRNVHDFYIDWQWNVTFDMEDLSMRIALPDLSDELPDFNWQSYLKGLLPDDVRTFFEFNETSEIYFSNLNLTQRLGQLFARHNKDTIKSFVFLKAFYSMKDRYELREDQKQNDETVKNRCLQYSLRHWPAAMARIYFDSINADVNEWGYDVNVLGRNIISAFTFLLNSVDWVDAEDKETLQNKLMNIKFNNGIPSWISNDTEVELSIKMFNGSLNLFENEFISSQTMFDDSTRRLVDDANGKVTEEKAKPDPSFMENAEYDPDSNEINMFLGQIVSPYYHTSYPIAIKYGGLGTIIAHEIMHAFDFNNLYADESKGKSNAKEKDVRSKASRPERLRRQATPNPKDATYWEFQKKKSCLVQQYDKVCLRGACLSGEQTANENMADIDGIKVAYTAYKVVEQVLGREPVIEELIDYSNDQLFFLAFARNWCSNEPITWSRLQDEHAPDEARVNQALKNVALFAKVFKCLAGTKYDPADRCTLWGDLKEPAGRRKL